MSECISVGDWTVYFDDEKVFAIKTITDVGENCGDDIPAAVLDLMVSKAEKAFGVDCVVQAILARPGCVILIPDEEWNEYNKQDSTSMSFVPLPTCDEPTTK